MLIPIGLAALDLTVFVSSTQQNEQLAETAARSAATQGDESGARLVAQDAVDHFQTSSVIQSVTLDFVKFDLGSGLVQVGVLMDVKLPVPFPGYSVVIAKPRRHSLLCPLRHRVKENSMRRHSRLRKNSLRSKRGASIILIAACAVLLIFAVFLVFKFTMWMGGSSEVRNAVDAAALNVSKQASLIKVPAQPMYKDVADAEGTIGLQNINRVWGKAYLISANLQSMTTSGQVGPKAPGNEQTAYDSAQVINDQLAGSLKNKQALDQFFNQMAVNRPAKMLGEGATVATDQNAPWATAMVDRGDESNLSFSPNQLPPE